MIAPAVVNFSATTLAAGLKCRWSQDARTRLNRFLQDFERPIECAAFNGNDDVRHYSKNQLSFLNRRFPRTTVFSASTAATAASEAAVTRFATRLCAGFVLGIP